MLEEKIISLCKNLEKIEKIRILFAIENGSRAWGMSSKDSDYDVRFVYVRPIEEYIQIQRPAEVIQASYDEYGQTCPAKGAIIDMSGFDIFKFVKMLSSSNPTTIEWLMSDIVYYGKQNKVLREFAQHHFSKKSLYYHYKSMCQNNYLKYLKSGELVTYKKYLYAYRGLINALHVVHKKNLPPLILKETLKGMNRIIPTDIFNKLNLIIDLKSQGKEKDIIQNIPLMDRYIESFLEEEHNLAQKESQSNMFILNTELRRIVFKKKP
ncbi:nucleotidyltransferase domain-containing protein [Candidatus Woesearchaeota archaeon]|nr:nucleotidyltransferase domain-containing protein [Candidatus Woesearchaeota archaeon]